MINENISNFDTIQYIYMYKYSQGSECMYDYMIYEYFAMTHYNITMYRYT